ncbi:eukaryotic aspartyl protease family protein [Medicago truncatula]|uniref:Eukaryotic aspartyl protease family protein n=2 Tax=Medicago truncatula TaxID=3880 RepID=A0A072URS6_MEDTR|nr:eukaryotic aspartyl protease family protein [Medicago truncatula]
MAFNIATMLPFFLSFVFLYFIIANGGCELEQKKMFKVQMLQRNHQFGSKGCILPESRKEKGAIVLEMKDRGYCSERKINWNRKLQKQLIFDDLRVRSMQNRIRAKVSGHNSSEQSSEIQIPLASGINLETLNYIVTIGLGNQNMTVIIDTGSDLTWVQCDPCMSCYSQQGPVFNPSNSSSYNSLLCNSSTCQNLQFTTGNTEACESNNPSSCNYTVSYGDGSFTDGELGVEHLSFGGISVSNFVFGCGRNNKGLFGGVSGIMGLGRSNLSMISQTNTTFGGVFSYCLPTTDSGASGSLVIGNESSLFKNLTPIAYTSMVSNPQLSNFYVLNLTGIDVGGVAIQDTSFGNGGILIDSGTVITRLAPSLYNALKAEFLKQFSGYPIAPALSILDTCFNLTGIEEVSIPTLSMHFENNVDLNVDAVGILYMPKDGSQVCLALASLSDENDMAIIGNYQQRNQRVIYDAKQSKIGFAREDCSFI